jgi:preprotein translocase SecY subunit
MLRRLLLILTDKELRNKLLIVIGLLIVTRLLTHIPIPIFENTDLTSTINSDPVYNILNTLSGGGYGSLSFVMLGIGPYITASIMFQLLGVIIPKLNDLQKEGEAGRQKVNQWTRLATIPLAALNGWGVLQYLQSLGRTASNGAAAPIKLPDLLAGTNIAETFPYWCVVVISLIAGSMIFMWIAEIITEYKMGNGISLIIFTGIVSRLPKDIINVWGGVKKNFDYSFTDITTDPSQLLSWDNWRKLVWDGANFAEFRSAIVYFVVFLITLAFMIYIYSAERKLKVVYARSGASEGKSRMLNSIKSILPIKVNVAGIFPIFFALYFILFPSILSRFFVTTNIEGLSKTTNAIEAYLSPEQKKGEEIQKLNFTAKTPEKNFAGFSLTGSADEINNQKAFDVTRGQEIFGFTISTKGDVKNSYFEGTPLHDVNINGFTPFEFNGGNMGFLPEVAIRNNGILAYYFFYFILIIFFTYFYTSTIAFKTEEVAKNLQESGAYIPGIRPGEETQNYLDYVVNRINVIGSLSLALIALIPILLQNNLRLDQNNSTLTAIVGGTTLVILVSVVVETMKALDAQASIVDYDRFIGGKESQ